MKGDRTKNVKMKPRPSKQEDRGSKKGRYPETINQDQEGQDK